MNVNTKSPEGTGSGTSSEDILGPLKMDLYKCGVSRSNPASTNSDMYCAPQTRTQMISLSSTPPATPPGSDSPIFPLSSGSRCAKRVSAPTSAVDDVMEKFGSRRPRSLTRLRHRDRRHSLPAWQEESDGTMLPFLEERVRSLPSSPILVEDRRTAVSVATPGDARRRKESEDARCLKTSEKPGLSNVTGEGCQNGGCNLDTTDGSSSSSS